MNIETRHDVRVKYLSIALLIIAACVFIWRGPLGVFGKSDDLAVYYASARAFLNGQNPYDAQVLHAQAVQSSCTASDLVANSLTPPATLVIMVPLAVPNWPVARAIWLAVNLASLGLIYWSLLRLTGTRLGVTHRIILAAIMLGLAPLQTSIALGQTILPALAVILCGIVALGAGRWLSCALLLAIGTALKPQTGAVFLAYMLLLRQWRIALTGGSIFAALTVAGALRLQFTAPSWLTSMRANYDAFFHGGICDIGGACAYQLLQLQAPLLVLTGSRLAADIIAWTATLALAGLFLWMVGKHPGCAVPPSRVTSSSAPERTSTHSGFDGLLPYAIVALLSLMCVYHRLYDSIVLLMATAWALASLASPARRLAWTCIALALPFLFPGPAMLNIAVNAGSIPGWVSASWWWRGVVMMHQVWLLLAMATVLLIALAKGHWNKGALESRLHVSTSS